MPNIHYSPSVNPQFDPFVQEVQRKLNAVRVSTHGNWEHLNDDGKYGPKTSAAVKAFQVFKKITPASGILSNTTCQYLDELYRKIPILTSAKSHSYSKDTSRTIKDNVSIGIDVASFFFNDGMFLHRKLEKLIPIAFQRLSHKSEAPTFVFSKSEAYHNVWGAKYKRINIPDNVSKYLGTLSVILGWINIKEKIDEYKQGKSIDLVSFSRLSGELVSTLGASGDTLISWFPKLSKYGIYTAAEAGAPFTLAGSAAISTVAQCVGAFLLGWEIGNLIGIIPVGDGRDVQDCIDDYIDKVWEHPYKTLGAGGLGIAIAIDSWKKIIDISVNRVSNLKPLTAEEKRLLEKYIRENKKTYIQAAPSII